MTIAELKFSICLIHLETEAAVLLMAFSTFLIQHKFANAWIIFFELDNYG